MKILEFEKNSEEWLEARQTVITGTRVKEVKPLSRKGKTGTQPMGLWKLVAEYVSYGAGEESPMVRGTNLEAENVEITLSKCGLENCKYDTGVLWKNDEGTLGYSPDGYEDSDRPTWAIECKSLNTAEHLYLVMSDLFAQGKLPDAMEPLFQARPGMYRGIDSVAEEHRNQVLQAFVVNPDLDVLYYSLYDPRIVMDELKHYTIVVKREEIAEEINDQKKMVWYQADLARDIVNAMVNWAKEQSK